MFSQTAPVLLLVILFTPKGQLAFGMVAVGWTIFAMAISAVSLLIPLEELRKWELKRIRSAR